MRRNKTGLVSLRRLLEALRKGPDPEDAPDPGLSSSELDAFDRGWEACVHKAWNVRLTDQVDPIQDLDTIESLARDCPKGPWQVAHLPGFGANIFIIGENEDGNPKVLLQFYDGPKNFQRFVAETISMVPALTAEIRQLRKDTLKTHLLEDLVEGLREMNKAHRLSSSRMADRALTKIDTAEEKLKVIEEDD